MQASKLNTLDKFVLTNVGSNVLNGSYWGFCSVEDYESLIETTDVKNSDYVSFHKLKSNSGVLIRANSSYLFSLLDGLDDIELDQNDKDDADTRSLLGILSLDTFLRSNKRYKGFIGVNETTDSTSVSISQVIYPSFQVDIDAVMHKLSSYNLQYLNHLNKWVTYDHQISKDEFALSFTVSPTKNCMVLPIKLL